MGVLPTYNGFDYRNYTHSGPSSTGTPTTPIGAIDPTSLQTGVVSGGLLYVQSVYNLSSAQLLGLPTTKIQLVAAPGAGYALVPDAWSLQYKFNTTAYTIANADNAFQVEYTGKSTNLIKFNATGLVDQSASTVATSWPAVAGQDLAQTNEANLGLELTLVGTTPALTLGDGTLISTLRYYVLILQ